MQKCGTLEAMKAEQPPKNARKPAPITDRDDPRYEPTAAELEEDMRIDAMPEELIAAMFGRRPRRTVH